MMKTMNDIREGFYKNVGADDKILNDFLKEQVIVNLKGKDYIICDSKLYDVDDLRSTWVHYATGENIRPLGRKQFKNEMTGITFISDNHHIQIQYTVHSTTGRDYREAKRFDSICGQSRDVRHKDELLKQFLEKL